MGVRLLYNLQGLRRNSLSRRKIRVHPQPLEDEILSSWFSRVAVSNLTIPATFLNLYFGDFKFLFNSDFDWSREDFIKAVSQRVGFSEGKVFSLTLRSYEGYLFESLKKFSKYKPFIMQSGVRGRRSRNYALRYCPYCLRESEYFRKKWRLAFSTVCVKHKVFLLDRCPVCGEPLTIYKWRNDKLHFHCWKCGFEFRNAEAERVPAESKGIEAVKKLYEILEKGYFSFEGRFYYSIAYFKVLGHLAKVVYTWQKRNWDIIKKEEEIVGVKLSDRAKGTAYYDMPLKEHYVLFTALADILSSKKKLEKFIADNKVQKTELTRDFWDYPFWYKEFVDKFDDSYYSPTIDEVKSAVHVLKLQDREVNWENLQKIMGKYLDARKRPDIGKLLAKEKIVA